MNRKKITVSSFLLILIMVLVFSLSGCYVPPKEMYYTDLVKEEIASIEIYDCSEEYDSYKSINRYTIDEKEPMFSLDDSQIESFLKDLSEIRFYTKGGLLIGAVDPSFNFGKRTAKINFLDGSALYLSDSDYCVWMNADGSSRTGHHLSPDKEEWESFINSYTPNP